MTKRVNDQQRQRAKRGEARIATRPDGRLFIRIEAGRLPNGNRRRVEVSGRTEDEVREAERKMRATLAAGKLPGDRKTALGKWLDAWLEYRSPAGPEETALRYQSWTQYEGQVRLHIKPHLGGRPIGSITELDINRFLDAIAGDGHRATTHQRTRSILHGAFEEARARGVVPYNPVSGAKKRKAGRRRVPDPWTLEQAQLFTRGLAGSEDACIYAVASFAALRASELCGLRWSALSLDGPSPTLAVAKKLTVAGRRATGIKRMLELPKSESSLRTIGLSPEIVALLRAHRTRQEAARAAAGDAWVENGLVFRGDRPPGSSKRPDVLYHEFTDLVAAMGLPHIRLHDLRRLGLSISLLAGADPLTTMKQAGHSKLSQTERYVYGVAPVSPAVAARQAALLGLPGAPVDGAGRVADRVSKGRRMHRFVLKRRVRA